MLVVGEHQSKIVALAWFRLVFLPPLPHVRRIG
uniref:Uncharacterized protein n=1 Tax=Setaria viridis TaxID=4556 RepID=A0A4U6UAB6_SETVI|nr:hypothetical protein SEVIR_6G243850v2 [Setaria viridis]